MKRAISFIVTAAMLLSATAAAMPANAVGTATYEEYKELMKQTPEFPDPEERCYSYTDGDFEFRVYKEFAVVSDYKDTKATEITIPAEVPNTDTKKNVPVVGLVDTPFGSCHKLEKITIPDTLDHFTWRNLIVTTMVLIDSKEEVVPTVKEVAVSDTNPNFTVKDGLVYSKDMKTLVGCPPALGVKEVVLPEETETIGDYAFGDCYTLEKAVVPSTIKEMENDVFAGCINLKYAELPESMTFVPGQTFTFCTSLEEVKFNGVISEIGFESFYHCDSLKEFDIPDTVTAIGFGAFDETPCIENADGIRYLDNWVVKGDSKLCDVVIRDGTVGIAEMAFFGLSAEYEPRVLDVPASVKYLGYNCYIGTTSAGPGTVHFRAASFPLKTVNGKNYTDFYFYDPECDIFDDKATIPAEYTYSDINKKPANNNDDDPYIINWDPSVTWTSSSVSGLKTATPADSKVSGEVTIHGYKGSTAQKYAEKYGRKFELIADKPAHQAGDINGDGEVGIADAVCLQEWLLGSSDKLTDWDAADLCKDGVIDVYDMVMMRKKLIAE